MSRFALGTYTGIFATLMSGAAAHADPSCAPNGVCQGDTTYAYFHGKVHHGHVAQILPGGKISFLVDGEKRPGTFYSDDIAVTKSGACAPKAPNLCVGYHSARTVGGNEVDGSVTGFFTDGYVVLSEGGNAASAKYEEVTASKPAPVPAPVKDPLKDAVKAACDGAAAVKDHGKPVAGACAVPAAPADSISALLARVKAGEAPRLHEYLLLWDPKNDSSKAGNPWEDCLDSSQYNHPVKKDGNGEILKKCLPDTLYSWGPLQKIRDLEKKMGDGGSWEKLPYYDGALYLSESPASTFGYGSTDNSGGYQIRVKLKPWVKFRVVKDAPKCSELPAHEVNNTVYIRVFLNDHGRGKLSSGEDYILCSSEPVHSWSYGTKESYDELSKDVKRIIDPAHANDFLSYITRPDDHDVFRPAIWDLTSDKHPFSDPQLTNTLKNILLMSADDGGAVYFNPDDEDLGGKNAAEKRKLHFSTRMPNWFDSFSN